MSKPHTSESDGTSDRLRTITIKHGKLVYSSIDNLNYTENSRNGLLTIKTHGSESRGQEEAAVRDERVSYLHVALL